MKPILSIGTNSITAIFNLSKPPLTMKIGSIGWDMALEAVKAQNWQALEDSFKASNIIARASYGNVIVSDKEVYYKGKPVKYFLAERIMKFLADGLPINSLLVFLDNLMSNPSEESRADIYTFLETNGMTISEDGCFLAYRKVGRDYLSYHENLNGTHNRNVVGDVVSMDREGVCANRNVTCAAGLHFCSWDYLPSYYGFSDSRVMVVKINPVDVVAIPVDYNFSKGRCCKYTVVAEIEDCQNDKNEFDVLPKEPIYLIDDKGIKKYNVRDEHGRFVKKS